MMAFRLVQNQYDNCNNKIDTSVPPPIINGDTDEDDDIMMR